MNNKAEIARRNGAKSKGPLSIEGRRRASLNALEARPLTRNLKFLCLSNEDRPRLDELVARWTAKLPPRDEASLEMSAAWRWRLQRSWAIETATLDTEMDRRAESPDGKYDRFDEPVRLAETFKSLADGSQSLDVLRRYGYRLRRPFEQALSGYLRLRELPGESEADESCQIPLDRAA